jgi:restriction endonuclease
VALIRVEAWSALVRKETLSMSENRQELINKIIREVPRDRLMVAAAFLIEHQRGNTSFSTQQLSENGREMISGEEVNAWMKTLTIEQLHTWRAMAEKIRRKPIFNQ